MIIYIDLNCNYIKTLLRMNLFVTILNIVLESFEWDSVMFKYLGISPMNKCGEVEQHWGVGDTQNVIGVANLLKDRRCLQRRN